VLFRSDDQSDEHDHKSHHDQHGISLPNDARSSLLG